MWMKVDFVVKFLLDEEFDVSYRVKIKMMFAYGHYNLFCFHTSQGNARSFKNANTALNILFTNHFAFLYSAYATTIILVKLSAVH
jgi:hypothetical protein